MLFVVCSAAVLLFKQEQAGPWKQAEGKMKPKLDVWKYVSEREEVHRGVKKTVFKCKFCSSCYTKNATRIKAHLLKCKNCPRNIKSKFTTA